MPLYLSEVPLNHIIVDFICIKLLKYKRESFGQLLTNLRQTIIPKRIICSENTFQHHFQQQNDT